MTVLAPAAQAAEWVTTSLTQSTDRVSDLDTSPSGTTWVAYADGPSVKAIRSTSSGWSSPVTIGTLSGATILEVKVHAVANNPTIAYITRTTSGSRTDTRLYTARYISGSWTSASRVTSSNSTLRDISIGQAGSNDEVFLSIERFITRDNTGNVIFRPDFYVTRTAVNDFAEISAPDSTTDVEYTQIAPSGPRYLAATWINGIRGYYAMYDTAGNQWLPPVTLAGTTSVTSVSIAGSEARSSSQSTGVIAFSTNVGSDRSIEYRLLSDDDAGRRTSVETSRYAMAELEASWLYGRDYVYIGWIARPSTGSLKVEIASIQAGSGSSSIDIVDEDSRNVRNLSLAGAASSSAAYGTATWEDGPAASPTIEVVKGTNSDWSATAEDLRTGKYPMAVPTTTPQVLLWGTTSPYTLYASAYTDAPVTTVDPPENVRAVAGKNRRMVVRWQPSPSQGVTGYVVQVSRTSSGPWKDRVIDDPARLRTKYRGKVGVTYYFRVKASSPAGDSEWSPTVTATARR